MTCQIEFCDSDCILLLNANIQFVKGVPRRADLPVEVTSWFLDLKEGAMRTYKVSEIENFCKSLRAALQMEKAAAERVCNSTFQIRFFLVQKQDLFVFSVQIGILFAALPEFFREFLKTALPHVFNPVPKGENKDDNSVPVGRGKRAAAKEV